VAGYLRTGHGIIDRSVEEFGQRSRPAAGAQDYGKMPPVIAQALSTLPGIHVTGQPRVIRAKLAFVLIGVLWLSAVLAPPHAPHVEPTAHVAEHATAGACPSTSVGDESFLRNYCTPIPVDAHASEHCVLHCAPLLGALFLALWAALLITHGLALTGHILGARLNHPPLTPPPQLVLG
jgi:hypothetical protein